ncbi:MAG: S-adenosyl-l-methionine hydroxide adenosyltransferase family protein [Desulfatirhabdiaceae bacterium]
MVITLLTDFGLHHEYVGVMKGVILSILPPVRIVDLSHGIGPQDITAAAYMIFAAYPYFPKGTVHVVVVDPGVGSHRNMIAASCGGHFFVAPDNGLLTKIVESEEFEQAVRITNTDYFLPNISRTFHGRDVFAPVAAHVASGVGLEKLGHPVQSRDLVHLLGLDPDISLDGTLKGRVVTSDHFGNLITNISEIHLMNICPKHLWHLLEITVGNHGIQGMKRCYSQVDVGMPLAVIGSRGYLEIAVNSGSAAELLQFKNGQSLLHVQCKRPDTDVI